MREQIIERILEKKIIAIVRGLDTRYLLPLVQALHNGGISLVEVTFNQKDPDSWKDTCNGIRRIAEEFGGRVAVGAGTVLTKQQVDLARGAGAQYIISPDANPEVIRYTRAVGAVSLPGGMTPTEITAALEAGADFVKLFPVGVLGAPYVKAIRAPLSHARMLAVGGVNEKNAADFLRAGCVGIGVGGNLVNADWIAEGAFDRIEALAKAYVNAVNM